MNFLKKMTTLTAVAISLFGWSMVHASVVIFNQDFSSSTAVGDYDNGGANQFDAIGSSAGDTWTISSGALSISVSDLPDLDTRQSYATRTTTDFSPVGDVVMFKAQLLLDNVVNSSGVNSPTTLNGNNYVMLQFGDNLSATTLAKAPSQTYTQVGLSSIGAGWFLRSSNGDNSSTISFGTSVDITFFMNNSGTSQTLTAPDASTLILPDDQVSLWIGTTQAWATSAEDGTQDITSLGIYTESFNGARTLGYDFTVDNINISVIPEPSTFLLVGLALVVLLIVGINKLNFLGSRSRVR